MASSGTSLSAASAHFLMAFTVFPRKENDLVQRAIYGQGLCVFNAEFQAKPIFKVTDLSQAQFSPPHNCLGYPGVQFSFTEAE